MAKQQDSNGAQTEEYVGGYDCDIVNASLGDSIKCGICHHVLRDAQQTICCGQNFCKQCIDKTLQTKTIDKKCPFCSVKPCNFVPDTKTQRQVYNSEVYCPNRQSEPEPGCSWTDKLRSMKKHLDDECQFTEVQCSSGCRQMVQRRLLEDHLKLECELRQVNCEYCGVTGTFQWITGDHRQKECASIETNYYKQQLADTREKLQKVEQLYKELQQKFECCNKDNVVNKKKLSAFDALSWSTQLNCLATEQSPGLPTIIKMPHFNKSNQDGWPSPPFTTDEVGYKMVMKVYANGYLHGDGRGKFISVALYLMSGDHDERVEWPLKGTVSIQLLNQLEDQDHSQVVHFRFDGRDPIMCARVTNGSQAERACWAHKFIAHESLQYNYHKKHQYLKDKCIFFRIQSFVT